MTYSAILKKKDCKDTQPVIEICSDHLTNVGLNVKITAMDCSHHHFQAEKNADNITGHIHI